MMVMILAGCSDIKPYSLEPTITLSEASDISHTEATVEANIDMRGSTSLSFVTLIYGETGSENFLKIQGTQDSGHVQFHLSGLKPAHSYSCYIEGGTTTATIRSNTISFATLANDCPKLSSPISLSTGPLGVIVEFSIIDDGGEPIIEAGCQIKTVGTSESRRVYLQEGNIGKGDWQINITGLTPLTTYIITPFASNFSGESQGEPLEYTTKNSIVLQQPGQLANLFGKESDYDIECLTISGLMNGDDFKTLRIMLGASGYDDENLSGIKAREIDLSDVNITEGGGSYDGSHFTVTDELTTGILADCPLLRNAILPNTARCLARNAFATCYALECITISASIEEVLPSSDCTSLRTIEVSKANNHFSSTDGVLFNHDGTEILWFPFGKSGDYQLPPTITAIKENAFAGTSITRLTIPSSVTDISRGAFAGSALTEIILPDNITNISEGLFQNCSNLHTVYLGSGTEYLGNFVFDGTTIKNLYLAAEIPPFTMEDAFTNGDTDIFGDCTLHVPIGCKKIYANHQRWGRFNQIEEFQP